MQVSCRRVGGVPAARRIVNAAVRLLGLGIEVPHGDPELSTRLQHPQACDLQAVVVPVGNLDQVAEHGVVKSFPPPDPLRGFLRDERTVGLLPFLEDRCFGPEEVGADGLATRERQHQADPGDVHPARRQSARRCHGMRPKTSVLPARRIFICWSLRTGDPAGNWT